MGNKRSTTKIRANIENNSIKISYFVKWYVDSKDKSKDDYEKNCKHNTGGVEYEYAITEWLVREDVQGAIKEYLKAQRVIKMLDIYQSMYSKALEGDKQCADWCEKFFKSDFFENSVDEIDDYLDGINIPGLKKSGDK